MLFRSAEASKAWGPWRRTRAREKPAAHSPHPHTSMDMDACTPLASSTPVVVGRRVKSSDRDGSSVPFVWLNRTSLPRIVDDEALTARSDPGTIILGFGRSVEEGQLTFIHFNFSLPSVAVHPAGIENHSAVDGGQLVLHSSRQPV